MLSDEVIRQLDYWCTKCRPINGYVLTNDISYQALVYHLLNMVRDIGNAMLELQTDIDTIIRDEVNKQLDNVMIDAIYHADTETIELRKGLKYNG